MRTYVNLALSFLRGSVRPGLPWFLVGATVAFLAFSNPSAAEFLKELTIASVMYWLGARTVEKTQ